MASPGGGGGGEHAPVVNNFLLRFFNELYSVLYSLMRSFRISIWTDVNIAVRFLNAIKSLESNETFNEDPQSFLVSEFLASAGIPNRLIVLLFTSFKNRLTAVYHDFESNQSDGEAVQSYFDIRNALSSDEYYVDFKNVIKIGIDKDLITAIVTDIVTAKRGAGIAVYQADFLAEIATYIITKQSV